MWEAIAADLVKEDGQWKIWHLTMYNDFTTPVGTSWADKDAAKKAAFQCQGPMTSNDKRQPTTAQGIPLDVPIRYYEHWSIDRKLRYLRQPEPYYTFSKTFSYDPPPSKDETK